MIDTLKPLIKQFMPFAQERMGFKKPPRLFLRQDEDNARNPLGKTAFYDPDQMSVTLYISGRHPKDIMRSLSHELVHHTQNDNGMFNNVGEMGEGYAQNDEHLREMERQAYEQGNLCFRDWEDGIRGTIYFEHLQKGAKNKMSTKKWKNNELKGLLTEQWGFSMDLSKLSEANEPDCKQLMNMVMNAYERGEEDIASSYEKQMQRLKCGSMMEEAKPKPDFPDIDGDGDTKEPISQAADDKEQMNENDEVFAPNHYCVHHGGVSRNGSIEMAEAVNHNYNEELGKVTHYDMKFSDGTIMENVAFEDIQVTNASLAEAHQHAAKRDDKKREEEEDMNEGHGGGCPEPEMGGDAAIISNIRDLLAQLEGSMGAAPMDMGMEPAMMEEEEADQPVTEADQEEIEENALPMSEAVLRERIRTLLKNVKFKK